MDRKTEMQNVAMQLGMDFLDKADQSPVIYLKDFRLFRQGVRKRITNLMSKRDGLLEAQYQIFDYQYTISTGKSSHTFKQTVFFLHSKKLGLPQFFMQPETIFHRFKEYLGFRQDINFAEFPKFSEQYYLRSSEEDYLRATFKPPVLKLFSIEPNWRLEGLNYYLVLYRDKTLLPPRAVSSVHHMGMRLSKYLEAESPFLDL